MVLLVLLVQEKKVKPVPRAKQEARAKKAPLVLLVQEKKVKPVPRAKQEARVKKAPLVLLVHKVCVVKHSK